MWDRWQRGESLHDIARPSGELGSLESDLDRRTCGERSHGDQRGADHSVGCAATCHRRRGEHARFRRYLLGLRDRERGQLRYRSFRRTAVDADRRTSREIAQCELTRANVSSLEDRDAKPKHLATKCDFPGISYAAWLYANRLTKRTGRKDRRFALCPV